MINTFRLKRALALCLLVLMLAIFITGCETTKAVHSSIHEHRVAYCARTADSITKKAAILAIKTQAPLYPMEGICVGIDEEV